MPQGIYTQTVCILLNGSVSLDRVAECLSDYSIRSQHDFKESWALGGPSLLLDFQPEVNGTVLVDTVDHPWPDSMGDPDNEPMIFAAWSMGAFGPFTYPGGLGRAAQQCWSWDEGKTIPQSHTGFLRIRTSYVLGLGDDAKLMPEDYKPAPELRFITDIADKLLNLPEALCYYNPNGEVLCPPQAVRDALQYADNNELLPLDLWANVRLFNVGEGWFLMDTVGNSQLWMSDVEACCPSGMDNSEVYGFLRNTSWYLFLNGEVIKDGDTMDGPGGRWQAHSHNTEQPEPPRKRLCWLPQQGEPVPQFLVDRISQNEQST